MAKITKKQLNFLQSILLDLKKVEKYIAREDLKICHITKLRESNVYRNGAGESISEADKRHGSDIVHLECSIKNLGQFCLENG